MNRKEAIQSISLLLGGAVVSSQLLMNWSCSNTSKENIFDADGIMLLDEIAETIIPATDTPGARDAKVGAFIALMIKDCYELPIADIVVAGLDKINDKAESEFGTSFVKLSADEKLAVLTPFDKEQAEQKQDGQKPHFFRLLKELTLLGYFTSELGSTKALRYVPVPGRYEGCIDYKPEDKIVAPL